jgi:hypothetical protein
MSHLVPCPECSRHVRVSETACPFCATPLGLAGTPEPQLPKTRLGRAATFAFSATLASATALAACGTDNSDDTSAGGSAGATSSAGTGGTSAGTGGASAGTGGTVAGTTSIAGTGGSAMPVYGAPAAGGSFGTGTGGTGAAGGGQFPVYGAAP